MQNVFNSLWVFSTEFRRMYEIESDQSRPAFDAPGNQFYLNRMQEGGVVLGLAQSAADRAQWYIVEYKRNSNKVRIIYRFKKESGEQIFPSTIKRSVA